MKAYAQQVADYFCIIFLIMFFVSCGSQTALLKAPAPIYIVSPPVVKKVHDTVTIRKMTSEQYKASLKQMYREAIDSLISPQFRSQTQRDEVLTSLIKSMFNQDIQLRYRTRRFRDSLNKGTDSTIFVAKRSADSANRVANDRQGRILSLTEEYETNSKSQLKWLGLLTLVIAIAVAILYRKVSKLGKQFDALQKTISPHE